MRKIKEMFGIIVFCSLVFGGIAIAAAYSYPNEECGHLKTMLDEKTKDPGMYPGFHVTQAMKNACPSLNK